MPHFISHPLAMKGTSSSCCFMFSPHSIVAIASTMSHHITFVSSFMGGSCWSGLSPVCLQTVLT